MWPPVLLFLDPGQDLAETLVLNNGGMTDPLQLVESRVRQRYAFPAPSGKSLISTILPRRRTAMPSGLSISFILAAVHQLVRDLPLLTPEQYGRDLGRGSTTRWKSWSRAGGLKTGVGSER